MRCHALITHPLIVYVGLVRREKIGEGFDRTRRKALCQVAEGSIKNLSCKIYLILNILNGVFK